MDQIVSKNPEVHEAAHAVAAITFGIAFDYVSVSRVGPTGGKGELNMRDEFFQKDLNGKCTVAKPLPTHSVSDIEHRVVLLLAGMTAEIASSTDDPSPFLPYTAADDVRVADELIEASSLATDAGRLIASTVLFVCEHWPAIAALENQLRQTPKLQKGEVDLVVRRSSIRGCAPREPRSTFQRTRYSIESARNVIPYTAEILEMAGE